MSEFRDESRAEFRAEFRDESRAGFRTESKTEQKPTCYHKSPQIEENPKFFIYLGLNDFSEYCTYKCRNCGYLYVIDLFTEEGQSFEKKWNGLYKDYLSNQCD